MRFLRSLTLAIIAVLALLALFSSGPAFAQAPPLPFSFTFDENGHGSVTFPNGGPVVPLTSFTMLDPDVHVATLFYVLTFGSLQREGFVGLTAAEPDFGLSDVLHFSSAFGGGVFFYSNPTAPGEPADLADVSLISYLMALSQSIFTLIPEVGSEGTNGAFYVPGFTDPGFLMTNGIFATYNIISDAGPRSTVPEPSSLLLLATGVGLASLARVTRRRHRHK